MPGFPAFISGTGFASTLVKSPWANEEEQGKNMAKEKVILERIMEAQAEKWFIELLLRNSNGEFSRVSDSNCSDFPFNPDNFGPFEEDSLILKLKEVFPGAEILLKWQ